MSRGGGRDRRRAERAGLLAERLAALLLRCKGYRIVARRLRTPLGELDLLARKGGVLAVVEVKARPDLAAAMAAVTPRQRQRLERAAAAVAARDRRLAGLSLRFDLVAVTPWRLPRHILDAWRPDSPSPGGRGGRNRPTASRS